MRIIEVEHVAYRTNRETIRVTLTRDPQGWQVSETWWTPAGPESTGPKPRVIAEETGVWGGSDPLAFIEAERARWHADGFDQHELVTVRHGFADDWEREAAEMVPTPPPPLAPGDRVRHPHWGTGRVLDVQDGRANCKEIGEWTTGEQFQAPLAELERVGA